VLRTRCRSELTYQEVSAFDNALRIFPTREAVNNYNHQKLHDLQQPILRIVAESKGTNADKASIDDGINLHIELTLAIGYRIVDREHIDGAGLGKWCTWYCGRLYLAFRC
jgi:hypothetical protein